MDKLTTKSQEALAQAISAATAAGNPQVEPLHLLDALLHQSGGVAVALLDAMGVNRAGIAERVKAALAVLPGASGSSVNQPQASRPLSLVITDAGKEATALGDSYISTEHLLLAIAASQSQAGDILRSAGATRDQLAAVLPNVRGSSKVDSPDPEGTFQALEKYGQDLTQLARDGKMDPVIGRDQEIRRVVQVLSRRTKNNPVLIGEPGVGKTAVVEGLAQRMVNWAWYRYVEPQKNAARAFEAARRDRLGRRTRCGCSRSGQLRGKRDEVAGAGVRQADALLIPDSVQGNRHCQGGTGFLAFQRPKRRILALNSACW